MAALLQLIEQQTHLSGLPARTDLTMGREPGQAMHYLSPPNLYGYIPRCQNGSIPILADLLSAEIVWVSAEHQFKENNKIKHEPSHRYLSYTACWMTNECLELKTLVGPRVLACAVLYSLCSDSWQG